MNSLRHRFRSAAALALLGFCFGSSAARADRWTSGLRLEAPDILEEGLADYRVQVHYPLGIDLESLDDEDLWVVSRNGYNELADLEEIVTHWPEWDPAGGVDPRDWPRDGQEWAPWVTAIYRVRAPDGESWKAADLGSYTVLLQAGQVRFEGGAGLPASLLGVFRVRIGEPQPDLPVLTTVEVIRENGVPMALVRLHWNTTGHEVEWGELQRMGNGLLADIAISGEGEADAPETQEHRYDLGGLPPGVYRFAVVSGEHLLAEESVSIDGPGRVPADVELSAEVSDDGSARLHARIHFLDPYFVLADPGEPRRDGNRIVIGARAERVEFIQPPEEPAISEVDYDLGVLPAGAYRVIYTLNGEPAAETAFLVPRPDLQGIQALLRAQPVVEAGGAGHQFAVIFQSGNPIDLETLGDDDILVSSWVILARFTGEPPLWGTQDAKLERFEASDDNRRVQALYSIQAPEGGWSEAMNGPMWVELRENSVADVEGNFAAPRSLGEIPIRIEPAPPVPARAAMEIERDADGVWAHVKVVFPGGGHTIADWGEARREGRTIFLDAQAVPREEPPPDVGPDGTAQSEEAHRYLLWKSGEGGEVEIPFEPVEVSPFLIFGEPENVVLRSEDEFGAWASAHWNPEIKAPLMLPDVDWTREMLVGVYFGPRPLGVWVEIARVTGTDAGTTVHSLTVIGGAPPPEDVIQYPGAMVKVPRSELPVAFVSETLALPSPPPGGPDDLAGAPRDAEPGEADPEDWRDGPDGFEEGLVVFRINGYPYAREQVRWTEPEPPAPIPADAEMDLGYEDGLAVADVRVRFHGFPYHQIADWGEPRREGHRMVFDAKAEEVQFLVEPDLPLEQEHRYILFPAPVPAGDETAENGDPMPWLWGEPGPDGVIRQIEVVFRINGEVYARELLRLQDDPNPGDKAPRPSLVEVAPEVEGTDARVRVVLGWDESGVQITSWGEVEERGHLLVAEVRAEVTDAAVPGGPYENVYDLGEREPGHYAFLLTVDGRAVGHAIFRVAGDDEPLHPFQEWLSGLFERVEDGIGGLRGLGDLDGDGVSDFAEFALGGDALQAGLAPWPKPEVMRDEHGLHLGLRFHRRSAEARVRYILEGSEDLRLWTPVEDGEVDLVELRDLGGGLEAVAFCLKETMRAGGHRYLRLRMEPEAD